jgi:hypothetical protein
MKNCKCYNCLNRWVCRNCLGSCGTCHIDIKTCKEEEDEMELKEGFKSCRVAENLQEGLQQYIENHILPGNFLTACLENNLKNALGFASTKTWDYVFSVMNFLYNYAPAFIWGSPVKVKDWIRKGAR